MYTAAEARRIDIERGGEGRIRTYHKYSDTHVLLYFDEKDMLWRTKECGLIYDIDLSKDWLPVTPEREYIHDLVLRQNIYDGSDEQVKHLDKINKLEAENAELKKRLRWKDCESEKPENKKHLIYRKKISLSSTIGFYQDKKFYAKSGDYCLELTSLDTWLWREV